MAAIANVALTNTFDSWRSRSNQSFTRLNQFAVNESSLYANTLTANVAFVSKGLATMQGKATVGTNLVVTANTTTNKLTVTSNLAASGNVQLGDASTDIVNIRGKGNTFASFIVGENLTVSGNTSVGENLTVSGNTSAGVLTVTSANAAIAAASANPALRITQTGTGLALIVEDSASPDSNPVVIDTSGNMGIGTTAPSQKLEVYASATSLQIQSVVRNDMSGAGVAAIGFNVSSSLAAEATSTKAGIGLVRSALYGGGSLCFYNNNSGAAGDFTTADEKMRIDSGGLITAWNSMTVTQNLIVTGNTTLGDSGAADKVTINGGTTLNQSLAIGNNLTVSGNTTLGDSASADKVTITGGVTLNQSLAISENLTVSGNTTLGNSASADKVTVTGGVTMNQSLVVSKNLTVSSNSVFSGTINSAGANILSQTLTDDATITWNTALGQIATVTLAGNRTMAAPTNLKVGTYILRVYQDATGSRSLTWNGVFKWTAAVAPVLSTTANALDIITLFSDGTNLYGSYLPDMR
jgi:hypothetical protein